MQQRIPVFQLSHCLCLYRRAQKDDHSSQTVPTPLQGSPFRSINLPEPVMINEDFTSLLHNVTYEKGRKDSRQVQCLPQEKSPEKVTGLRGHRVLLRCHQQEENGGAAQLQHSSWVCACTSGLCLSNSWPQHWPGFRRCCSVTSVPKAISCLLQEKGSRLDLLP